MASTPLRKRPFSLVFENLDVNDPHASAPVFDRVECIFNYILRFQHRLNEVSFLSHRHVPAFACTEELEISISLDHLFDTFVSKCLSSFIVKSFHANRPVHPGGELTRSRARSCSMLTDV